MADTINLAILSCAHIHAEIWLRTIPRLHSVKLIAIWDDDVERGRDVASKAQVEFEPDLSQLLSRSDIDAVAIASENSKHAELAIAAAQAGKHIMCEKPMATTLAECDRMIQAVENSGVTFYQIFPMRYDPVNHKIKEIVESGELGQISLARKRHGHYYGYIWEKSDPDIWFTKRSLAGGGAFLDEGVHVADWLRWIFGDPISVMAQIDTVGTSFDVDDTGAAIYRFPDKSMAVLHSSWLDQAATNTTEIYGSKGTIIQLHTDGASNRSTSETSSPLRIYRAEPPGWQVVDMPVHFPKNQEAVIQPFVDCLLEKREPPVTAYDGRRALEIILAAYRSAEEGRLISIGDAS